MMRKKSGFTLIELIVVLIIIGILSSIAAPLMNNMKVKAMCAEAVTDMGAIRTALQIYYIEYNAYPPGSSFNALSILGLPPSDFQGRYIIAPTNAFRVAISNGAPDSHRFIECTLDTVTAPEIATSLDIPLSGRGRLYMFVNNGQIAQSNLSKSGYIDVEAYIDSLWPAS